ncbi:MAG: winged helix-turn-helix transcriptional regulator [Anaerolineales bacterium]|nr:winged helix-turn-helix transcriptional regulator [Anaerolineales bacterium]
MLAFPELKAVTLKAKLFRGFADPSRLGILEALSKSPLTVGQIMQATGLSQPNTSNHLSCLYECGLVRREQQGRFVSYSLSDERVKLLLDFADDILAGAAERIYECTRYKVDQA